MSEYYFNIYCKEENNLNKITFVGAGSMAEAIIAGITSKKYLPSESIYVTNNTNQERLNDLAKNYQVTVSYDKNILFNHSDIIVLSMKPKDVTAALKSVKPLLHENQLVLSVLAGVSTDFISNQLGTKNPVIRAMPNTSATIGQSATSIAAGKYATNTHVQQVDSLLNAIGTTTIVEESQLDLITALAGSGPAYLYYTIESMQEAASQAGLDEAISKELILQTLVGVTEMLKTTSETPSTLREKITSPGGTTEAGVKVLQNYGYQEALIACVNKAAERSQELRSFLESK
ncbi:pyrroline-5-carboxylate reductase [Aquibacillus sediminis]|uniref:pyrroline-5-carboxylate reductase n=1 Tax=Aquibacillus sediminis TaxID=2574734 RepID=UPI00110A0892|nr:pyrroline-5-carboxylate reductase [Aquibacillus sediminis]